MTQAEIDALCDTLTGHGDRRLIAMRQFGIDALRGKRTTEEQHDELEWQSNPIWLEWFEFWKDFSKQRVQKSAQKLLDGCPQAVIQALIELLFCQQIHIRYTDKNGGDAYMYPHMSFINPRAAEVSSWLLALDLHPALKEDWRHKLICAVSRGGPNNERAVDDAITLLKSLYFPEQDNKGEDKGGKYRKTGVRELAKLLDCEKTGLIEKLKYKTIGTPPELVINIRSARYTEVHNQWFKQKKEQRSQLEKLGMKRKDIRERLME